MSVGTGFLARFSLKHHIEIVLIALSLPSSAAAQNYLIMNLNSGRVLDVTGGGSSQAYQNGTAIQQWDWSGGGNQQWQVIPLGNGYNEIVNVQSGKALDVRGASTNPSAVVQQWDWLAGANQQWQLVDLGDGSYKIKNLNSGLMLDVDGARVQNGAGVLQLWDQTSTQYTSSHSQPQPSIQWILVPLDSPNSVSSMPTDGSNDGTYSYFSGQGCGGSPPGFVGLFHAWICGSQVKIHWQGFNKTAPLQKSIDNWNNKLRASYGFAPVALLRETGGPEGIHVYTVGNTQIPCTPPAPAGCYARAQNTAVVLWRPPNASPSGSSRLRYLDIQIIEGMTYGPTLTNTFAHEVGHTFGLADCYNCGPSTVMDSGERPPSNTTYAVLNFKEGTAGPTNCDISVIQNNVPDYFSCSQVAEATYPQSCQGGATQGFADVGPSGEYTCNGAVCDGCNGACNNFAPGNGCSGTPDAGCSSYCGDVCMDGLYCPDMYLGNSYYPSCDANGNVYCPSDTNYSPILLDIFGEGFHLTSAEGGVRFTLNSGRDPMQVSWTDPNFHNGWLVLDRNGNGTIDDLSEMFGNFTKQPNSQTPNGYLALAVYDDPQNGGNGNGMIDSGDQIFARLQVWIDENHNGISEPQELHSLTSLGITSIGLNYTETPTSDTFGNAFRYQSTITTTTTTSVGHTSYDVYLQVQRPQ